MGRIKKGERGGKAVPGWRGSEELGTLASLEHMVCAGKQLGWADSLGLYFKDLEFLVKGYVIYPTCYGTLWEVDAILFLALSFLP